MEKSGKLLALHKAFFIKEYDTIFEGKYPLLCVQDASSEKQHVRAQSRFPTEIKKDLLYLGNMMNIMNKDYFQLTMLKIKTIFYFAPEPFPDIDNHFNCVHIQMKEQDRPLIDFDPVSE